MAVPVQAQEAPLVAIKPSLHLPTPSPLHQRRSPSLRLGPSSSKEVLDRHLLQNGSFSSLKSTITPRQDQTRTATPIQSPVKGLVDSLARLPKQEAWCSFVKYVEILHQGSTMVSMHVKAARAFSAVAFSRTLTTRCA